MVGASRFGLWATIAASLWVVPGCGVVDCDDEPSGGVEGTGVSCAADDICQTLCAADPDCATSTGGTGDAGAPGETGGATSSGGIGGVGAAGKTGGATSTGGTSGAPTFGGTGGEATGGVTAVGGTGGVGDFGPAGTRCGAQGDCAPDLECVSEFFYERLVCTRACSDAGECPPGTACVPDIPRYSGGPIGPYCLVPCTIQPDCDPFGSECDGHSDLASGGRFCF